MKKLAIIIPGVIPCPDIKGGAVEELITKIVYQNEKEYQFDIDLYTLYDKSFENIKYKHTKLIKIKSSKMERFLSKIINKFFRILRYEDEFSIYFIKSFNKLKKIKYDYILVENNMISFRKIVKKYKYKTKYLFHLHNDIGGFGKSERLCNFVAKNAFIIFTVSKFIKTRFLKATEGIGNVKILYNAVDLKKFYKYDVDRKKYGLNNQDFVFMYIGRISPVKGVLEVVKSFKYVAMKNKNVKLCIVGDSWFNLKKKDAYLRKIEKEIAEVKDNVILYGLQNPKNIVNFYNLADCIIVPTLCNEAFGMVVIEAMACEKAIITTATGGISEIIDDNCAIRINKNNIETEMKNAMIKMIETEELSKKLGKNGYKRIKEMEDFNDKNYYNNFICMIIEEKNKDGGNL